MAKPIYSKFVQTSAGAADPSASFTVVNEETGLDVDIYSDRAGTTVITPPYFADSSGLIRFYYDEGITIRIAVTGASGSFTDRYQEGRVFGGEPGNSPRILDFQVDSISQLPPATGSGRKVSVTGYHAATTVGGGEMVDAGLARHNGVTLFDPNRVAEIGTAAYYVDSGSDANCWERVGVEYITPEMAGKNTLDELQTLIETNINGLKFGVYSRLELRNSREDTAGVFDAPNFAGQTDYGNEPIGFVFHHYTDGDMIQIDNVGEDNDIMRLKNAQNPNRRPDKPSSFVGSGNFLAFDEHDDSLGFSQRLGFIDKTFKIVWTGVKGIATLWQNKAEDGTPAFRLQTTNNHDYILNILNGLAKNVFNFRNDVGYTRARIESHTDQTSGMYIVANAGNLTLDSSSQVRTNKPISTNSGNLQLTTGDASPVESFLPFKLRQYSTSTLPSAATYSGCIVSISDRSGKQSPIVYSDGSAWYYMNNTTV